MVKSLELTHDETRILLCTITQVNTLCWNTASKEVLKELEQKIITFEHTFEES